jgi:hypothetical protein
MSLFLLIFKVGSVIMVFKERFVPARFSEVAILADARDATVVYVPLQKKIRAFIINNV